jgi:hypothetical protein
MRLQDLVDRDARRIEFGEGAFLERRREARGEQQRVLSAASARSAWVMRRLIRHRRKSTPKGIC